MDPQKLLWIRFDEQDRRTPAPEFCLPSADGKTVCLGDFRGVCNLVLFFAHSLNCDHCRKAVENFIRHRFDYISEGTRIGVILAQNQGELFELLSQEEHLAQFPLYYLADPQCETRRVYTGLMDESLTSASDGVLFILNSFGAPYYALIGSELDDESVHQDTLKWLDFISRQCPE